MIRREREEEKSSRRLRQTRIPQGTNMVTHELEYVPIRGRCLNTDDLMRADEIPAHLGKGAVHRPCEFGKPHVPALTSKRFAPMCIYRFPPSFSSSPS